MKDIDLKKPKIYYSDNELLSYKDNNTALPQLSKRINYKILKDIFSESIVKQIQNCRKSSQEEKNCPQQ